MASLSLSQLELNTVRSSWGDVMAANDYKTNRIITELFNGVTESNPAIKASFRKPEVRAEQEVLFGELVTFTMMYLHNIPVLDECTDEFIKENPSVVKYGVLYLEPMGGVLIQYLRKTLGRDKFHPLLETLWIKVYIYIANCILQNDVSDVDSILDDTASKYSESEESVVEPLNLPPRSSARASAAPSIADFEEKKEPVLSAPAPVTPATPVTPVTPQPVEQAEELEEEKVSVPFKSSPLPRLEDKSGAAGAIQIDLGRNEKYKGFRRSVTESPKEPVLVKVPPSFISPKQIVAQLPPRSPVLSPRAQSPVESTFNAFDPRASKRRSSETYRPSLLAPSPAIEEKTPQIRAPKRQMPAWKRELSPEYSEKDMEVTMKTKLFDPRRNSNHRRTPSGSSHEFALEERKFSGSSCESPVSDCEDAFNLAGDNDDLIDFSLTFQARQNQVFDPNSFGIKGLAPIAETDGDESQYSDNASSNYEGKSSKTTEDESSSRASSLSLHSLDYKSSISSGLANYPIVGKEHAPKTSQLSDISFMAGLPAPSHNPYRFSSKYASSTPSLSTRSLHSSGKSPSLGFMRNSFVLKKEMETMGYNHPENVSLHSEVPRLAAPPSLARITSHQSVTSLPVPNTHLHHKSHRETFAKTAPTSASTSRPGSLSSSLSEGTRKKSFYEKLSSLFKSSSPEPKKAAPTYNGKAISLPINVPPPKSAKPLSARSVSHNRRESMASFASTKYDMYLTTDLTHRVSSSDFRKLKAPVGYAASVYLKPANDNASIYSTSSKTLRFSLFKSKSRTRSEALEEEKMKKNKYTVKKVPYRVIHVKDIVR